MQTLEFMRIDRVRLSIVSVTSCQSARQRKGRASGVAGRHGRSLVDPRSDILIGGAESQTGNPSVRNQLSPEFQSVSLLRRWTETGAFVSRGPNERAERKPGAFPRVLEHRQNPLRALWRSLCAQEILTTLSRQSEDRTRRGERRLKASDSHYWECTYDASACWMSITMRFPSGIRDGCCKNRRFSGD